MLNGSWVGMLTSTLVSALTHIAPSNLPEQKIQPSPLFPAGKLVEELPVPKMRVYAATTIRGPQSSLEDSQGLELQAGRGATEHKLKFEAVSLACFFSGWGMKHPFHLGTLHHS